MAGNICRHAGTVDRYHSTKSLRDGSLRRRELIIIRISSGWWATANWTTTARYTCVANGNDRRHRKPARPAVTASQKVQEELHRPAVGIAARSGAPSRVDGSGYLPQPGAAWREAHAGHVSLPKRAEDVAPGCRAALMSSSRPQLGLVQVLAFSRLRSCRQPAELVWGHFSAWAHWDDVAQCRSIAHLDLLFSCHSGQL